MYKSIDTASAFRDEFAYCGRKDQFSYDGLDLLFDYLEETDYQEVDVVALCCQFSEESVTDVAASYRVDVNGLDNDDALDTVLEYLNYHTSVVGVTDAGDIVYCSEF